jgi:hypothetical protein
MTFPAHIVNIGALDATVFVTTDARPFVIDASNYCEPDKTKPVLDVDAPLPDLACGRHRSAVVTPFGFVYSSQRGLVLLKADATYEIVTSGWLSPDQWLKLRPETARLAYWEGRLFCVTDEIAFVLYVDAKKAGDSDYGLLSTISDRPLDMAVTPNGALLMLEDGAIWHWNAGDELRPYVWESADIDFQAKTSPQSALVETDGCRFTLLVPGEGEGLSWSTFVSNPEPFRLGRLGSWRRYRVRLEGTGRVDRVCLGTSYITLAGGK